MNLVFVSGVQLGRDALEGILDSGVIEKGQASMKAIFSLDEARARRTVGFIPFDDLAKRFGCPLHKVKKIRHPKNVQLLRDIEPDIIFIIGWSELASTEILDIPKMKHHSDERHAATHGCIGMHPTPLPIGRGRAPIPWAIIKGFTKSAVTMFYLEEEADAGNIIAQREFEITFEDDAQTIYDKVARLHYEIMKEMIPLLVAGTAPSIPQDSSKAMWWPKRTPDDGIIDWTKNSKELYNWVRALTHPYPGAFTFYQEKKLFIWKVIPLSACAGEIIEVTPEGIVVNTGGNLLIKKVQIEGEDEVDASLWAEQNAIKPGDKFEQRNK
jgi:methionyl-tRNA formyltransferase